jgi:hypothetical protein
VHSCTALPRALTCSSSDSGTLPSLAKLYSTFTVTWGPAEGSDLRSSPCTTEPHWDSTEPWSLSNWEVPLPCGVVASASDLLAC